MPDPQFSLFVQHHDGYGNITTKPSIPLNSTVEEADKPRLAGKAEAILAALRAGPKTNVELAHIGGIRYSARLAELKAVGVEWEITARDHATGVNTYTLISEPTNA
jgi:hypothetical protein